jgi:hypothetical protein
MRNAAAQGTRPTACWATVEAAPVMLLPRMSRTPRLAGMLPAEGRLAAMLHPARRSVFSRAIFLKACGMEPVTVTALLSPP